VFSADSESASGWTEFLPANVKKLRFRVAVQPTSLRGLLRHSLRRALPALDLILVPVVDRLCQWRAGYPLGGELLLKLARGVNVPVLYAALDPTGSSTWAAAFSSEIQGLYDAASGPKQLWKIDASTGLLEACAYVCAHLEPVLTFAAEHTG
jgi:hypothetical protein